MSNRSHSLTVRLTTALLLASAALVLVCATARAERCEGCSPGWAVYATNFPTNLAPAHSGVIEVEVYNVGAGTSEGSVTVTDTLPESVTATSAGEQVGGLNGHPESDELFREGWICSGNAPGSPPRLAGATVVTCTNEEGRDPRWGGGGTLGYGDPGVQELGIAVHVSAEAKEDPGSPQLNRVTVAGGGAPAPASASDPVVISSTPSSFRVTNFDVEFSNRNGTLDTQAGSHPYEAMFNFGLATSLKTNGGLTPGDDEPRHIEVVLPPGFVGDPTAVPQCTRQEFMESTCPEDSQIGIIMIQDTSTGDKLRLFNLVPPPGVPAEFGFTIYGDTTYLDSAVRSGSDYGLTTNLFNTPQVEFYNSTAVIWGIPGDQSHDRFRSAGEEVCTEEQIERAGSPCSRVFHPDLKPFLTLPTACGAPPKFTIRATSWQHPEQARIEDSVEWHDSNGTPVGLTGCEHLGFAPKVTTEPDTARSDTPTGLTVEVKPPTGGLSEPEGLSTADIQNTTVTLPHGFVINPGQAAGLAACQSSQDGLTTEAEKAASEEDSGPAACPNASQVGTDEIETPLLPHSLKGGVYVMQSNPPELKLLVAASGEGVNLKLVGIVHLNEQTGQLTTTFAGTPELPFTDFKLSFSGGAQAALDTPAQCGVYESTSDFTAWASPFVSDAFPTASFGLTEGPNGSGCPSSPLPFTPTLIAGSTTDHAGGFTDFSLLLERGDGQQRIEKLQFKAPEGLAGMISSVPLCGEPQAAEGMCSAVSQVGHSTVSAGPGPYPLVIPQPGEPESPIYLTGPYDGAPFGLSIVTHVIAGPFNLGTIITRAKIEINPQTAQITVTTDPLPQVVDGVPTDLRLVDAVIDRPGFMFNPTNCEESSFSGTAWGAPPPGASEPSDTAAIGSHFGVGSCKELTFKPALTVDTKARASKADGASLSFKISYPKGAQGNESWFSEAKFDIPRQLPARLTTLQQACLATTYETNRAACPKASIIGHAVVHTPVLPDPLEGPVYFVSYGGAKFPDAVLDLTGDNVHIELHGETFINGKTGVTSATFRNTPDVPFESIEVNVPTGPYSEFGANLPAKDHYSFCGQKLTMPTLFKAQNGLEIHQDTPVTITNCPKPNKKAKKKTTSKKHKRTPKHKAKK